MTRKPIQIVCGGGGEIVCLCDDGSMWQLLKWQWKQIDDVPQPIPEPGRFLMRCPDAQADAIWREIEKAQTRKEPT